MLSQMDLLGAWVSIFLTVCILSFLYEDNPVYKLAEHLFLGVSIAIGVIEGYYGTFKPNMIAHLMDVARPGPEARLDRVHRRGLRGREADRRGQRQPDDTHILEHG